MSYKVSYKVLTKQGEELKAVAKLMDDYASRVDTIRNKLGSDRMLSSVQQNLQKLSGQLGEARVVLNLSGQVISQCVEGYNGQEKTIVQKIDSTRAHNRDFYKNPVAVASAGAQTASVGTTSPTIHYTDNSVNISVMPTAAAPDSSAVTAEHVSASSFDTALPGQNSSSGMDAAMIGATIAGGAAAGAAGLFGAQKLRAYLKQKEVDKEAQQKGGSATPKEDPAELLAMELEESKKYQQPAKSSDEPAISPSPDTTPKFGTAQ